jgi:hypothetical protein
MVETGAVLALTGFHVGRSMNVEMRAMPSPPRTGVDHQVIEPAASAREPVEAAR